MKRAYKVPKAVLIDFTYDEQVTATSTGDIGQVGDPLSIGLCQQLSATQCHAFWSSAYPIANCRQEPVPWSLRDMI